MRAYWIPEAGKTRGTEWDELGATGMSRDFHKKGCVPIGKLIVTRVPQLRHVYKNTFLIYTALCYQSDLLFYSEDGSTSSLWNFGNHVPGYNLNQHDRHEQGLGLTCSNLWVRQIDPSISLQTNVFRPCLGWSQTACKEFDYFAFLKFVLNYSVSILSFRAKLNIFICCLVSVFLFCLLFHSLPLISGISFQRIQSVGAVV